MGGGEREREMEMERDSRCCEALPSHCLSSLCLIGLPPPSPPLPPPSTSHPPLPAVTRAMGRQPWRLLVLPLLLLLPTLSPLPPFNTPPPNPPYSPLGLAEARMRKPRMGKKKKGKGGVEEEQQILIHLMAPIFFSHMI